MLHKECSKTMLDGLHGEIKGKKRMQQIEVHTFPKYKAFHLVLKAQSFGRNPSVTLPNYRPSNKLWFPAHCRLLHTGIFPVLRATMLYRRMIMVIILLRFPGTSWEECFAFSSVCD